MSKNCPPHKVKNSGCDIYGKQRLELAIHLCEILNNLNINWFIENGTLLGAYRNNKFIPHDDDFDIAILYQNNIDDNIKKDMLNIKSKLSRKYDIRLVDTYTKKLEVFNPSFGKYKLVKEYYNNADFHHVTVDLQAYILKNNKYKSLHSHSDVRHSFSEIFPFQKIVLENTIFQAPNNVEKILKNTYGSIDENAKYNSKTGKYEVIKH
tara:strand:- start:125 stop:748 length:624 start_codon:yes stop_codon:yes gene_type:complete